MVHFSTVHPKIYAYVSRCDVLFLHDNFTGTVCYDCPTANEATLKDIGKYVIRIK